MSASVLSRRGFVAGAAAGVAGIAAMSMSRPAMADEVAFDESHDVVIVGAGAAGLSAALILQELGADFALLESEDDVMPSSMLSVGEVSLCETPEAPGSADEFYEDMLEASRHECQEDLVRAYVDNCSEIYDKLVNSWGVEFAFVKQVPYTDQAFCHCTGDLPGAGYKLVQPMLETFEGNGGEVLTGHRAKRLVRDAAGRVVGVIAETQDGEVAFEAKKGVLVATGGFTRNPDLINRYGWKRMDQMTPVSGQGHRGDGLLMGISMGAATKYMCAGIAPSAAVGVESGRPSWLWGRSWTVPYVMMDGKRFCAESGIYVDCLSSALALGDVFFQVYDASAREQITNYPFDADPEYTGETVEELAQAIKEGYLEFDADAFVSEMERYNGFIDAGEDEDWGATLKTNEGERLGRLENGPFYAMPFYIGVDHFTGGLQIDASNRVEDVFGETISGLYAAGEVAGGLSSWSYMEGSMNGRALIQGMIAARTIMGD